MIFTKIGEESYEVATIVIWRMKVFEKWQKFLPMVSGLWLKVG